MMNILKSGYEYDKKVPKTNTNSWKVEWFYAYCLKIIIAERSPSRLKAKGLLDRALSFNTVPGEPELNVKEVINPQGDPQLEQELYELLDFRKLMLVYRLIHYRDKIPDLDINIKRRNEELCKPCIRLFYGSQAQTEVEQTFQTFLDTKTSKKAGSLEATLIPVIIDLVQQNGNSLLTSEIWDFIRARLDGQSNPHDTNEYYVGEYTLYKSTITRFLEDKFGARYRHTEKGGKIIFSPDKLQKIVKSYDLDVKIKTRLKTDTPDTPDTSSEQASPLKKKILQTKIENSQDNNKNNVNISQNEVSEDLQTPPTLSQGVSDPSGVSGTELSLTEEQKAALRADYDAARAKIRRELTK